MGLVRSWLGSELRAFVLYRLLLYKNIWQQRGVVLPEFSLTSVKVSSKNRERGELVKKRYVLLGGITACLLELFL